MLAERGNVFAIGDTSRVVTRHDGSIFAIGDTSQVVTRHDSSIFAIGDTSRVVTRHDGSIFAMGDARVRCTSCLLLPSRCPCGRGTGPIAYWHRGNDDACRLVPAACLNQLPRSLPATSHTGLPHEPFFPFLNSFDCSTCASCAG